MATGSNLFSSHAAKKLVNTYGGTTQPVYINNGIPTNTTYTLGSTVSSGTANRLTYYSGANTLSATGHYSSSDKIAINSTSAPSYNLYVNGDAYYTKSITSFNAPLLQINNTGDSSWIPGLIQSAPNITAGHYTAIQIGKSSGSTNNVGHLSFYYAGDGSTNNRFALGFYNNIDLLTVRADGNVGIGTASPSYKLHVAGTGYFSGVLTATSDVNFISHGNEFNYVPTLTANIEVHINHRQTGGNNTGGYKITKYHFKDGAGGLLATISSGQFSGNAATATRINGTLGQATSNIERNIWVSSTSAADGIPNYVSGVTINASTKTITATNFAGNASSATTLKDRTNNTLTYSNYGAAGLAGSSISWMTCWNGYELRAISKAETFNVVRDNGGDSRWVKKAGDTMTGRLTNSLVAGGSWIAGTHTGTFYVNTATNAAAGNYFQSWFSGKTPNGAWGIGPLSGSNDLYFAYGTDTNYTNGTNTTSNIRFTSDGKVYGAVWNDYAEYRAAETAEPGRCVREDIDGILKITTKRLEKGCEIVSDTYGFAIGQTGEWNTPVASTGRVLAYPDKDRNTFVLGMPVCSGPNGTVSQMTEEEARMYPWCIIGTVSEIPNYEIWGQNKAPVNGRIWIRIK